MTEQFCETMSNVDLFQTIEGLYSSRQLEKLEAATTAYLDRFHQNGIYEEAKVKFYRTFARHDKKPDLARTELEELLKMPISDEIRFFAQCNLEKLPTCVSSNQKALDQKIEMGIVALTLEEYPDRQKLLREELAKHNLEDRTHIMVNKLNPRPGIGCFLAHIDAIKWAQENGFEQVLIFEDDIKINPGFSLENCLQSNKLPKSWDMLYFGGILTRCDNISNGWIRGIIWCNHAYIVHSRLYSTILDEFTKIDLDDCAAKKRTIDWLYTALVQPKYQCWLAENQPIVQREGYSTLDMKVKWGNNFNWNTWAMKQL